MHSCYIYGSLCSTLTPAALHEVQCADTGTHIEAAIAAIGSERDVQHTGLEKRYIRANTKQFGSN